MAGSVVWVLCCNSEGTVWKLCCRVGEMQELDEWKLCDIMVLPGILLTGLRVKDQLVVRGMLDLSTWYNNHSDPELKLLRNTRRVRRVST